MKSFLFGPTLQLQSSFRCLSLWWSSASIAVLCVSCFIWEEKKSAVLFLDSFLEACLKELMTSATQTICIWRVLFQNEIFTVWKKERRGEESLHEQDDWQLPLESRPQRYFLKEASRVLGDIFTFYIWTIPDGNELLNGCVAFWNESVHMVLYFCHCCWRLFQFF